MHLNSTSLYWFPVGHPPFMCRVAEPTFLRSSVSSHCRGCPNPQGQQRGNCNSSQFQMRTLRYSLRRVSPLDSVNGGTHNLALPKRPESSSELLECFESRKIGRPAQQCTGRSLVKVGETYVAKAIRQYRTKPQRSGKA
jgi:hypothetical protein